MLRKRLCQKLQIDLCMLTKLRKGFDVDSLVLDVVSDSAKRQEGESLAYERGINHEYLGQVEKVLNRQQLEHLLKIVICVSFGKSVDVYKPKCALWSRDALHYLQDQPLETLLASRLVLSVEYVEIFPASDVVACELVGALEANDHGGVDMFEWRIVDLLLEFHKFP